MNPHLFREVTRTVTVSYPVPFVVACFLAFALCCVGAASATTATLVEYVTLGLAVLSGLTAVLLTAYAVLKRPDMMRSERYNLVSRYIEAIGDNEIDPNARRGLDRTMLAYLEEDVAKKAVPPRGHDGTGG